MKVRALLTDGTETFVTKERKRGSRRINDRSGSVFQNEFSQNGIHPEDSSRIDFTVKTEDRGTISIENEEKKEKEKKEEEEEKEKEEEEEEEGGERRRATTVQIGGNGRKLEAGQRSRRVSTTWHFRELRAERETVKVAKK
ncbi:hypothetical protein V1478_013009 [Vespula squamosa]|uniref:Uncharacterized protein n=1 Tax=Vespula squamosa TaxID=30214 RepID=A0ABD2A9L3_VESSQ